MGRRRASRLAVEAFSEAVLISPKVDGYCSWYPPAPRSLDAGFAMRNPLARLVLVPFDLLVGLVVLLDELVRPLYRPLVAWFASLALVTRLEAQVARLPPHGALLALALPFAVAEPLKLVALLLLARGAFLAGLVTMAVAHLGSFLLVERVYHAGRAQLLTIGWFARIIGWLDAIRQAVIDRIKASAAWRRAAALALALRERLHAWSMRIRRGWGSAGRG
jgi:hypothetical protein